MLSSISVISLDDSRERPPAVSRIQFETRTYFVVLCIALRALRLSSLTWIIFGTV